MGFEETGKGATDESSTFMPSINTSTDNVDKISERELSKKYNRLIARLLMVGYGEAVVVAGICRALAACLSAILVIGWICVSETTGQIACPVALSSCGVNHHVGKRSFCPMPLINASRTCASIQHGGALFCFQGGPLLPHHLGSSRRGGISITGIARRATIIRPGNHRQRHIIQRWACYHW